jgi:starch synthase
VVALLPFGDVFHDFLDPLGVGIDSFREAFVGSWMFGYVMALSTAGVRTVLICPTSKVSATVRATHEPTGAEIVLLPTSWLFLTLRSCALDGKVAGRRDPRTLGRAVAAHTAPYTGTPFVGLARELHRADVRAVLCQEYETPRFDICAAVGRAMRRPVFGVFQGGDEQHSLLERPLRPLSLQAAAGLLSGSAVELERVRRAYGLPETKLFHVPNPIDVSFWRPGDRRAARAALGIDPEARVVAWHGQFVRRKGLDVLLEAWQVVCSALGGRDLVLTLMGAGEEVDGLRRRVADMRAGEVRLLDGWVHDRMRIREMIIAADIYAFPSRSEGVPVAPAEAMACGLPVVGTNASGVGDVIGDCGVVVPVDDVAALASGISSLLDNHDLRAALGPNARARAEEQFSHDAVGAELRAIVLGRS